MSSLVLCPICDRQIPVDSRLCPYCGEKFLRPVAEMPVKRPPPLPGMPQSDTHFQDATAETPEMLIRPMSRYQASRKHGRTYGSRSFRIGFGGCLGVGCAIIVLAMVPLLLIGAIMVIPILRAMLNQ